NPLDLYQLAQAARFTSQYELANDSYRAALKPPAAGAPAKLVALRSEHQLALIAAGIEWADLFSQKYAAQLAAQTLEEVFKLKPDFFEAMAGAGLGYLRLGMEKEGLEWLDKAYKGDGYNVRTVNTLNLFEQTIPKDYTFETTKSFRIRFHNEEKPALARYLE